MDEKQDPGAELGKKLGKAFKAARPRARKLAADAGPIVSKAGSDALRYAREHEDEARQIAQKLVRARLHGPLGMMVDAFIPKDGPPAAGDETPAERACPSCAVENTFDARFCSQCGAQLTTPE